MKSQLFIPKTITVGCQHRSDTYTKRLAYVIYTDNKGVLRKEKSWRDWIQDKDIPNSFMGYETNEDGTTNYQKQIRGTLKGIPIETFDNVPTEGFVLNKGAGGHAGSSSSWNTRRETIRVYDPRDFEFEISIPNLLFILENSNSYKGKGLEGKFVYSWEGADLVLLPEGCKEYQESQGFTDLQKCKVGVKELILGATYQTKKQQDLIYVGKFNWYTLEYKRAGSQSKYHNKIGSINSKYVFYNGKDFEAHSGLANLATITNSNPVSNYAELADKLSKSSHLSHPIDLTLAKPIKESDFKDVQGWSKVQFFKKITEGVYYHYNVLGEMQRKFDWIPSMVVGTLGENKYTDVGMKYTLMQYHTIYMDKYKSILTITNTNYREDMKVITVEEIMAGEFYKELQTIDSSGATFNLQV